MDLWKDYQTARASEDFGHQRLYLRSRERIHASLSEVGPYGTILELNNCVFASYGEGTRYVLARDITYDLLVSIYDVNSSSALLFRATFPLNKKAFSEVRNRLGRFRRPNLEMRLIGMQNEDTVVLDSIDGLRRLAKSALQEVDLFGRSTRHVAFDLKVGMPLDLLTQNRIFRSDELLNGLSLEGFGRQRSELAFV
jgi:hypothetical protein